MAKWAVIRVVATDGHLAQAILTEHFAPITMTIDTNPPAAGPECEIRVQDRTEADLRRVLGDLVLVSKTVLDAPYEGPQEPTGPDS